MARGYKNISPFNKTWTIKLDDSDIVEPDIDSQNKTDSNSDEEQYPADIPSEIPILPIRNAVAFPGTVTPLAIGRRRSKKLISDNKTDDSVIGLLAQKNPETDTPEFEDLYNVGTTVSILKTVKMPQGSIHIVVHGIKRFEVEKPVTTTPYLKAKIKLLDDKSEKTKQVQALMVSVRQAANKVVSLSPNVPEEASVLLENIEDPSTLADFLAANLNIDLQEKQKLLEELDSEKRLKQISESLAHQLEVLELSHKIQGKVRESVDQKQRKYFLQEQLKAIQSELGHKDSHTQEIDQLRKNIEAARMPENVYKEAVKELQRLDKIPAASPEYTVIRTYLDWLCELPWSVQTEDRLNIKGAQKILNRDHHDLKKVKKRILEFLAVRKLNPKGKSPILCFVGPPGVGKTSLGKSIATAMNRKFVRISLGGIRDEADIRGHRRTYIGAMPGRILQEIRKCGTRNPLFMLDELDKVGADFRGDPSSALLEVLDPEQNYTFTDHYIDQPFDLSDVMFIGTANYTEPIPPALKDRMEVIELPGYTHNEKASIAEKYLIPRQIKEHGLKKNQITIKKEAVDIIIEKYTREAGVRNLERNIAALCRYVATEITKNNKRRTTIGKNNLSKILGPEKHESELALRTGISGVATALAYTPYGGELLFIESASMPGKGNLQLTGQIGEVMKESAQTAFSLVKANAEKLKLDTELFKEYDYHIHVPAGAVPKDGPSAGIAMFTSLASLLTGKPVRADIAMTGEITLRGLLLPVGGLKEKILAAKQAGIKTVLLPRRNKKDITEVPKEAKKELKFRFVKNINSALKIVLEDD